MGQETRSTHDLQPIKYPKPVVKPVRRPTQHEPGHNLRSDCSLESFIGLISPVVVTPARSRRTYLMRNSMDAQTPRGPPALTCLHVCSTSPHGNLKSAHVLDLMTAEQRLCG